MKFRELLEEYGVSIAPEGHHHSTEGFIQFDCPFCEKGSHKYHMGYNVSGGYVNCWHCGGHSLASTIQEISGLSYNKVRKIVEDLSEGGKAVVMTDVRERKTPFSIPACVGKLTTAHIKYLHNRGYDYQEIQRLWQIKGIGVAGRLRWRLFIPIYYQGKMVSWTTRAIGRQQMKYISEEKEKEIVPHKNILYGMDYVRHCAIITEGPMDVWAIGPGAVATFGTAFTSQQVIRLLKIPKRVICYDNEKEAQKQAIKLRNALGAFEGETINVVLDSKDPGEAKPKELRRLRKFLK